MSSLEFYESVAASGSGGGAPALLVQRTPDRSAWVTLPPPLASQLYDSRAALPLVFELRPLIQRAGISLPGGEPKYVAWGGAVGAPGALGVPAGLLAGFGLAEGRPVALRPLWDAPAAVSVTVEPASEDDWEVVELNAEYLEGQLLTQVGVVAPRQPFPFWVHTHLINLKVVGMEPAGVPAARLAPGSEIHVAPRVRVRPGAAAPSGQLFGGGEQGAQPVQRGGRQQGGGSSGPAAAPHEEEEIEIETALRVQCIAGALAAQCSAAAQQLPRPQQVLPPSVLPVGISPHTLQRCGLREGDWVRLERANSLGAAPAKAGSRFASLVPCAGVALGHLGLTAGQWAAFGVPPYSHIRVRRLGRAKRALVREAAELQQTAGGPSGSVGEASQSSAAAAAGDGGGGEQEVQLASAAAGLGDAVGEDAVDDLEGMGWLGDSLEKAVQALLPVLAATPRYLLQAWGVPRPGGLLVSGPAGSGKSALLAAAAAALQRHPQCLAYPVVVRCREITSEGAGHAQALIGAMVREALDHMPSLLVFDDLDVLCHAEAEGPEGGAGTGDPGLVAWLCDVMDYLCTPAAEWGTAPSFQPEPPTADINGGGSSSSSGDAGKGQGPQNGRTEGSVEHGGGSAGRNGNGKSPANGGQQQAPLVEQQHSSLDSSSRCHSNSSASGLLWPPVAFAATCKDPAALAAPLRAAGRLDRPLALPVPSAESRAAILVVGVRARGAVAAPHVLQAVAERADGFDAADLEVLLDRAMHLALRRRLTAPIALPRPLSLGGDSSGAAGPAHQPGGLATGAGLQLAVARGGDQGLGLELLEADLLGALEGMTPAAFWGVHTQKSVQQGVTGWEDVGGMDDVREALYEALELPLKCAKLVAQAPLRLRTGVLLYGPPGCGKTHVVSAAVAAANMRCITVSGPELLNKYIGASEAAVRDVFQRAAAAAPSVLFFDEFDAIAPQRGHDNTGVTDRVVNQLLTELDGVEGLRGVCVVAATSRPDLLDAALLRPGRLDRLLYCGFPSPLERGKVLRALARSLPLAPDVDLEEVAREAEYFTGADLSAVLSEAQLAAVHETLDAESPRAAAEAADGGPLHRHHHRGGAPIIARRHLAAAVGTARPSVPEDERDRLERIYLKFQQSREPGSSAADKGKGKKVSWA